MGDSLTTIIQEEIGCQGHISFARFMELALYHPELGYYRRATREVFGVQGDFYTAGQLQPVWGELLSSFVAQLQHGYDESAWEGLLDLGAGRQDLRAALERWSYRAFDWGAGQLPDQFSGMILANEFFDALPVHLLRRRKNDWQELGVKAVPPDRFAFVEIEETPPALLEYAQRYGQEIPEGGLLEASLLAGEWIARIDRLLVSGDVLILDYGYGARELARFPEGTLLGYRRHTATSDPLSAPGTRDLTAHVNFSYLRECAFEAGLEVAGESSLAEWALHIWGEQELAARWKSADERWRLQWKHLIFGMGETFRVLHLHKRKRRKSSHQIKTPPLPEA